MLTTGAVVVISSDPGPGRIRVAKRAVRWHSAGRNDGDEHRCGREADHGGEPDEVPTEPHDSGLPNLGASPDQNAAEVTAEAIAQSVKN